MIDFAEVYFTDDDIYANLPHSKCLTCGERFVGRYRDQLFCPEHTRNSGRFRNATRNRARDTHDLEFVAIDGEGTSVYGSNGEILQHNYVLMCATGCPPLHKSGERLTTTDIFAYLYDVVFASNPHAAFVGFSLGYDWAQWFRDLPRDRAEKLFRQDEIKEASTNEDPASSALPCRLG